MVTDTALAIELLLILLIVCYGALLSYALPKKTHTSLNILFAGIAVIIGGLAGLSLDTMGLRLSAVPLGVVYAAGFVLVIIAGVYVASRLPVVGHFFANESFAKASKKRLFYEAGFRVPLGTALLEEVLFRGLLLGLLLQNNSTVTALLLSSVIFGLWHIFPTVNQLEANQAAKDMVAGKRGRRLVSILTVVGTTTVAGVCFGVLRVWSGSLVTPWLVHWAINASGMLFSYAVASKKNQQHKPN